jgi:hypothetical protein
MRFKDLVTYLKIYLCICDICGCICDICGCICAICGWQRICADIRGC